MSGICKKKKRLTIAMQKIDNDTNFIASQCWQVQCSLYHIIQGSMLSGHGKTWLLIITN